MPSGKKLSIGFVLDDGLDKPDGVQQYILAVGEWLRSRGHQVTYLVGETTRQDLEGVVSVSKNIAVRFNGNSLSIPLPTAKRHIRKLLDAQHFDILHVQVPYSPFMAQRLLRVAPDDTAVIGTFHIAPNSGLVRWATYVLGWWLRPTLQRFDTMLSVSPAAQAFAQATFRISSQISPNVIEYPRFHGAQPLAKYSDQTRTILFLGRLVPRKGCLLLLQAIKQLVKEPDLPPFRVIICGKGPLMPSLESYIQKNELGPYVELVGFVSETDKPHYYASADISVFPSTGGESFGIVLLEAMASGRAVVLAGDNPGYSSVLEPKSELLFDPHNTSALAAMLRHYLTDEVARQSAAAWGAAYAQTFDIERVGQDLLSIYRKALRRRRPK